jgi:hypothetical protein
MTSLCPSVSYFLLRNVRKCSAFPTINTRYYTFSEDSLALIK